MCEELLGRSHIRGCGHRMCKGFDQECHLWHGADLWVLKLGVFLMIRSSPFLRHLANDSIS